MRSNERDEIREQVRKRMAEGNLQLALLKAELDGDAESSLAEAEAWESGENDNRCHANQLKKLNRRQRISKYQRRVV